MNRDCDVLVLGAGAAGMTAAIFASRAGASVVLVEAADQVGGTFHLSSGHMSAAGTRIQAAKRIDDDPERHYADVMAISRNTANPALVRKAVNGAADTLHWLLDNGLVLEPEHPVINFGHEPYSVPRTYWSPDEGRGVLKVIKPLLDEEIKSGRVQLLLSTKLTSLLEANQIVSGANLAGPNGDSSIHARSTLLATGGFTGNPELFSELSGGKPRYGGGYQYGRGEGLLAAVAIGAATANEQHYLPTFAAVEEATAPGGYGFVTQTYPQFREPWELYVDDEGKRFVREDEPSPDTRERALLAIRDMSFWALYDARIRREAPDFFIGLAPDEVRHRFESGAPGYHSANTVSLLAKAIGVNAENLKGTIARYNRAILENTPDPTGRVHRPLPLSEPPFYAVRHVGWSIVGFAGLRVDEKLRVLRDDGTVIRGLYAAGEILGLAATSGNSFCGGMSVTPAITFGRLLGTNLGAWAALERTKMVEKEQ